MLFLPLKGEERLKVENQKKLGVVVEFFFNLFQAKEFYSSP
jgi:hypothetical protein